MPSYSVELLNLIFVLSNKNKTGRDTYLINTAIQPNTWLNAKKREMRR